MQVFGIEERHRSDRHSFFEGGRLLAMKDFSTATSRWFTSQLGAPTEVQNRGWEAIGNSNHTLLIAPTGSGKTLAAFLHSIDELLNEAHDGIHTIYISPLKALAMDIDRNLHVPLTQIEGGKNISVGIRTGDTSQSERGKQLRKPPNILVTTPESLFLILTSKARHNLAGVKRIIVDEIHSIASSKRGAHLSLSLARVDALADVKPQRIGLSATVAPVEEVSRFLVPTGEEVTIIDCSAEPNADVRVVCVARNMSKPLRDLSAEKQKNNQELGMWALLVPHIAELVMANRSTIVFVNSRNLCERLTEMLRDHIDHALIRSHHGSLSHQERQQTEDALKRGQLRVIVSTSSLELGVDMGAVDLVIMPDSPHSTASALQRIGRAGHSVGKTSKAVFLPKHRGQLLSLVALVKSVREGQVEQLSCVKNALDVLAQHIVSMVALDCFDVDEMFSLVRSSFCYSRISKQAFCSVLDMLDGKYPDTVFSDIRSRIFWNREQRTIAGKRGAQLLAVANAGTIPDRGLYPVHLGDGGPRIGALDEEMVHEILPGQVFTLGAATWRVESINRDRVIVNPAPGVPGRLPFWRGDGPSRSFGMGELIGRVAGELSVDNEADWLKDLGFDEHAINNTIEFVSEQAACSAMPTDRRVVVERFEDEVGEGRVAILTPYGRAFHHTWVIYLKSAIPELSKSSAQVVWDDNGILMSFAGCLSASVSVFFPSSAEHIREDIKNAVAGSALFASVFREAAGRSLLLPKHRVGKRSPLWLTRLRSQRLLSVALGYPEFPLVAETYREILQEKLEVENFEQFVSKLSSRQIEIQDFDVKKPSPWCRGLLTAFTASFLYQGDVPAAEKKLAALQTNSKLLEELLGVDPTFTPLSASAIEEFEALIRHQGSWRIEEPADLRDLLLHLGEMTYAELHTYYDVKRELVEAAIRDNFVSNVVLGGEKYVVSAHEKLLYENRDLKQIVGRYSRTHGPFAPQTVSTRLDASVAAVTEALDAMVTSGQLVLAGFTQGAGAKYCDEGVSKRLRRVEVEKLRNQIQPVSHSQWCLFLAQWHGVLTKSKTLEGAVSQLQGIALPLLELVTEILPGRVEGFSSQMLERSIARGDVVIVGAGGKGKDVKVRLVLRRNVDVAVHEPLTPAELEVLEVIKRLGAAFWVEVQGELPKQQSKKFENALWNLVWKGLVVNDTLEPLLNKASGKKNAVPTGRWSFVKKSKREMVEGIHYDAMQLVDCYGVVCKKHSKHHGVPVRPTFAVYESAERLGKLRSGIFVEGIVGLQYASVDAINVLRGPSKGNVWEVSAFDPCQPFGTFLPWGEEHKHIKKALGARVVFVDGILAIYRVKSKWSIFVTPDSSEFAMAIEFLKEGARTNLLVRKINNKRVGSSTFKNKLIDYGFEETYDGLEYQAH